MTDSPRLFRKFLSFSMGPIMAAALSLVTTPIITRLILPEEYGKATMFAIACNVVALGGYLGADMSFVRFFNDTTGRSRRRLLWTSLLISVGTTLVICAVLLAFWRFASLVLFGSVTLLPVLELCVTAVFGVLFRYSLLVLRMKQRGAAFSLLTFANSAINSLVVVLLGLLVTRTFHAIALGMLASMALPSVVAVLIEKESWFRFGRCEAPLGPDEVDLGPSRSGIRAILQYGLPFVPAALGTWALESMSQIALRNLAGFVALGLYMASFKVVAALSIFQKSFSTFWAPVAFERYAKSPSETALFERTFLAVSGGLLIVGVAVLSAKDVIVLLLGPSYRGAATIMPFLVLFPLMYTVSEVTVMGINFAKRTYWHVAIAAGSAGICAIGNWMLVPILGPQGAAMSTGIAYVCFFFFRTLISLRYHHVNFHIRRTTFYFGLLIAFAGCTTFVADRTVQIMAAAVLLAAVVWGYRDSFGAAIRVVCEHFRARKVSDFT